MKNTVRYPAVFLEEEGGVSIEFPDLPGCLPCAENEEEAFDHAREALGLHIYGLEEEGEEIPAPSPVSAIEVPDGAYIAMIEVYMPAFRENVRTSTVRKTLTLPSWLNAEAERMGINFSKTLQDALKSQIESRA